MTVGSLVGRYVGDAGEKRYVFCHDHLDIKGKVNIAVRFTEKYRALEDSEELKKIEREVAICNFKSNKTVNFDVLPNVIKELMSD